MAAIAGVVGENCLRHPVSLLPGAPYPLPCGSASPHLAARVEISGGRCSPCPPPCRAFTVSACGPPSISVTSEKHFTGSSFRFARRWRVRKGAPRGGESKGEGPLPRPFESFQGGVGGNRNPPTFLEGVRGRCLFAKDFSPESLRAMGHGAKTLALSGAQSVIPRKQTQTRCR